MLVEFSLSANDVLLHGTSAESAMGIIRSNRFALAAAIYDKTEDAMSKGFYLSTTRHRQGAYHTKRNLPVVFILDGRKISQRYKTKPVDFRHAVLGDRAYEGATGMRTLQEGEERIISQKPFIPNAASYISGMDVAAVGNRVKSELRSISNWCRVNGIKLRIFPTMEAMNNNDTRNLISPAKFYPDSKRTKTFASRYDDTIEDITLSAKGHNILRAVFTVTSGLIELMTRKPSEVKKLSPAAKKFIRLTDNDPKKTYSVISDLFEYYTDYAPIGTPIDNRIRGFKGKLDQIMTRHRISHTKQLAELLAAKWPEYITA